jgi:hypothetical protein
VCFEEKTKKNRKKERKKKKRKLLVFLYGNVISHPQTLNTHSHKNFTYFPHSRKITPWQAVRYFQVRFHQKTKSISLFRSIEGKIKSIFSIIKKRKEEKKQKIKNRKKKHNWL